MKIEEIPPSKTPGNIGGKDQEQESVVGGANGIELGDKYPVQYS